MTFARRLFCSLAIFSAGLVVSSNGYAAVVLVMDDLRLRPGENAFVEVFAESDTAGEQLSISAFDLVLTLNQIFGGDVAEFTLEQTDADFSTRANYVFAGLDTNPVTIGDTVANPLRVGRSDFTLDPVTPRDGPLLLGRFLVTTDAIGDSAEYQIVLEDINGTTALFDTNFAPITIVGFTGGSVRVTAVPETTCTFLVGAGLVGALLRRKRLLL